jgi:nucleoporin NDC1
LISKQFEGRRSTIYTELDRANGSTWSQIYSLGTSQLTGIQDRIKAFKEGDTKPTAPVAAPQPLPADGIQIRASKDSAIRSSRAPATFRHQAANVANNLVREAGSHPGAVPPPHRLLESGARRLLTQEQFDSIAPDALYARGDGMVDKFLSLTVAEPLCQPFGRRVQSVICGSPTSRASMIVDAVSSLSALAVHSLRQDSPGQVQKSIGPLLRIIAATITDIQNFIRTAPPHWTDVRFKSTDREDLPEDVAAILAALKSGLEEILRAFEEYFGTLGVSREEARVWRAMVAREELLPRPVTPERGRQR